MTRQTQWTCSRCGRLLGERIGNDKLEIRVSQRFRYVVSLPVACDCPRPDCGIPNEIHCSSNEKAEPPTLSRGQG
jgi:hypothetical protein